MKAEIRALISDNLLYRPGREALVGLGDEADLLQAGVLTSLKVVQLVSLLEARYDITLDALDIDLEHLGSIAGIARLVARKRQP